MEKIAICITTRNRPGAFRETEKNIYKFKPDGATVFVVDDASIPCYYPLAAFTFRNRQGIPRAKNKCLELAMMWGVDHIFLFDDDCYPISKDWQIPYVNSGLHHACYTFLPYVGVKDGIKIHSLGNGCMLYFTRHCIETVGGFDTAFGMGKFEHTELSHRIHNAGLTPYVFMDVVGSDKLFHSMDEHDEVLRTMTDREMDEMMKRNAPLFNAKRNDRHFKPFREISK